MCQCSPCGWVRNLSPEVQECFHELCTRRCENRDGCAWRAIASRQTDRQKDRQTDRKKDRLTKDKHASGAGLWTALSCSSWICQAWWCPVWSHCWTPTSFEKSFGFRLKSSTLSIGGDTFGNWDCCNSILRANSADLRLWGPLQNVCGFRASAKRRSSQLHGRLPVCSLLLQEM